MKTQKPILIIEDDQIDAETLLRACRDVKLKNPLAVQINGEEALHYLREENSAGEPCLILLDLNMPKMSGLDFLRIVKNDARLKHIPVVVLTTSTRKADISETFALGAAGYMVKPILYTEFVRIVKAIDDYWTASELPSTF